MRTEGLITDADEGPSAVIGVRQAVCDAARDVVGYEVLARGLPADIEAALLDGRPPYGALLDGIVCHLDVDFTERAGEGPLTVERVDAAYRAALGWVEALRAGVERGA